MVFFWIAELYFFQNLFSIKPFFPPDSTKEAKQAVIQEMCLNKIQTHFWFLVVFYIGRWPHHLQQGPLSSENNTFQHTCTILWTAGTDSSNLMMFNSIQTFI